VRGPKNLHPARVHARGVVPQPPTRRRRGQPQPVEELSTIDTTWLGGVTGGRIISGGGTDPKILAGLQGLTQAIAAIGKTNADKSSQSTQMTLKLLGDWMDKHSPKPPGGK
jgi:hypothetical protein